MIKNILLFIIFTTISTVAFGHQVEHNTLPRVKVINVPTKLIDDTLKIQNSDKKEAPKIGYEGNNMPWVIALVISIAGMIFNLVISNCQIRANRESTLKQIVATLSTSNRQAWVTETRNVITELITEAKSLNIEIQEKQPNSGKKKSIHEKITYNRNKLLLLLKPDKPLHKNLLDSLSEFITVLDKHLLYDNANNDHGSSMHFDNREFLDKMNNVIENGRILLYDEWRKIQSIA